MILETSEGEIVFNQSRITQKESLLSFSCNARHGFDNFDGDAVDAAAGSGVVMTPVARVGLVGGEWACLHAHWRWWLLLCQIVR